MNSYTLQPDPLIAEYVKSIVVLESDAYASDEFVLPLIADGLPGIVFQSTDAGLFSSANKKIDNLFLYGQVVNPLYLSTKGRYIMIGYFFTPAVLNAFFKYNAKELTDVCIDLSYERCAKVMNIKERLIEAGTTEARIKLMDAYVLLLIQQNYSFVNHNITYATERILNNSGIISLPHIQNTLNISERSFQRLFEFHVGVSPKLYSRICQFNAAYRQLTDNNYSKLSDVAYGNGYADQSHFIRVFKEFTNHTPKDYMRERLSIDV